MQRIFLRADASTEIGLGHLSRALALASALPQAKVKVFSVDLANEIYSVFSKPFAERGAELVRVGAEQEFLAHLAADSPDVLVIDLRELSRYQPLVKELGRFTFPKVCFDGFFLHEIDFDLVVYPYFPTAPAESLRAETVLAGPEYFIFRSEFLAALAQKPAPNFKQCTKVLVSMGGADPAELTAAFFPALADRFPQLHFRVVLGPGFSAKNRESTLENVRKNIEILDKPAHLASAYQWADCALISAGLTKYETALFGIPSLAIAQNDQEEELTREFARAGSCMLLGRAGKITATEVAQALEKFVGHAAALEKLAEAGRKLADGHGAQRVAEAIARL